MYARKYARMYARKYVRNARKYMTTVIAISNKKNH